MLEHVAQFEPYQRVLVWTGEATLGLHGAAAPVF